MKLAIQSNAKILALFAISCTLVVALVHLLTKDTIAEQQQKYLMKTLNSLVPASSHDNEMYKDCVLILDKLGQPTGEKAFLATMNGVAVAAAIETTAPDGYNGKIELLVAVTNDNVVSGVRVLKHNETPGLGDKIEVKKSDWITSFNGKRVNDENDTRWQVEKDGGMFDQFTGATITPRAIVGQVKRTALYFAENKDAIFSQYPACEGK